VPGLRRHDLRLLGDNVEEELAIGQLPDIDRVPLEDALRGMETAEGGDEVPGPLAEIDVSQRATDPVSDAETSAKVST